MKTIILTDRTGHNEAVKELRDGWLSDLLIYLGIDEEEMSDMPKDRMVEYFIRNELEIIEYPSIGAVKVSHEGEVVGEWAGPEMTLKEESDGSLYFEVEIEHWSIAEEEIAE